MSKKNQKKFDKESKDDYNLEEDIVLDQDETSDQSLKKLREKLKKAIQEKQEYLEGWQRAKADFVNYKKGEKERSIEDFKRLKKFVLGDFLPILDSLEMAAGSASSEDKDWTAILNQLKSVFAKEGLVEVEQEIGEKFNPSFHEAVESVPVDSKDKDDTIIEVVQKGYRVEGKLIRPARVKVGKFEK